MDKIRELGVVRLVQLQPGGLIIERDEGYFYDVSRRLEVDQLLINDRGIEAVLPDERPVWGTYGVWCGR